MSNWAWVWSLEPSDVIRGASQQRPKLCAHYALGMTGDAVQFLTPAAPRCVTETLFGRPLRDGGDRPIFGDFAAVPGEFYRIGTPFLSKLCAAATAGRHSIARGCARG